jgi:peptidoglycan/xylan/chitin deacetylase (PgdA/CDA1 family)
VEPPPRPRFLRQVAKVAFHYGGGIPLLRYLNRDRVRILTAHRFTSQCRPQLEARCGHLRKYYNVIGMEQIGAWLAGGTPLPPNPVVQTVDDGYRDFYLHAYPIFAKYRVPVMVHLVSGFIDRVHWMWWDKVTDLFARTSRSDVIVELPSGQTRRFHAGVVGWREKAAADLIDALTRFPYPRILECVAGLPYALSVELPDRPPPHFAPLTWDEAREMMARGICFGAHTMTHALLPDLESAALIQAEVDGSKRRLEAELGVEIAHFAYPNGDHDRRSREAVRAAGFRTAVTTVQATVAAEADPFALPRLSAGEQCPDWTFEERAAGFCPPRLSGH